MTAETILKFRNIKKSYGQTPALNGVSMSIDSGTFVGVLGPNGAGKTTLFQIVTGLLGQDQGAVELFGMTHAENGPDIRRRIGIVYQDVTVDLDLSVGANLRFHGKLFGLAAKQLSARIETLSRQFGLSNFIKRPVRDLSGGERRKVEIARALIHQPGILLLDEASAGLDPPSRLALIKTIQKLAKDQGVAVLWASHLVDEVENADQIIVLSKGLIVASGNANELVNKTGTTDLVAAFDILTKSNSAFEA